MAYSFDGVNKIITLSAGTTSVVLADLWSRWKDWLRVGNAGTAIAFDTVGGEEFLDGSGGLVPLFLFIKNGWRIRPQEANHTLSITGGTLIVEGGGDPFLSTIGAFSVRIRYSQPVVAIGYSSGGAGGLTAEERKWLLDLAQVEGLVAGIPLVVNNDTNRRTAGTVDQDVVTVGNVTTVTLR